MEGSAAIYQALGHFNEVIGEGATAVEAFNKAYENSEPMLHSARIREVKQDSNKKKEAGDGL
jgi:hypothetical protein